MSTQTLPSTESLYEKIRAFLLTIVPDGWEVVQGIDNEVPMPRGPYVLITHLFQRRLATNIATYSDPAAPAIGEQALEQKTEVHCQFDFYGPTSGDVCAGTSTLWRDEYGCRALDPTAQPLYIDDGRMVPLVDGEEQYLQRWTSTAVLQYNPVTAVVQQFADAIDTTLINVDEAYPP